MQKKSNNQEIPVYCPIESTIKLVGNKWKLRIIWQLMTGKQRFGELQRAISGGISQKALTDNLRDLEKNGILTRTAFAEVPPRVEYELTEIGKSLCNILYSMDAWGVKYLNEVHRGEKFTTCIESLEWNDQHKHE